MQKEQKDDSIMYFCCAYVWCCYFFFSFFLSFVFLACFHRRKKSRHFTAYVILYIRKLNGRQYILTHWDYQFAIGSTQFCKWQLIYNVYRHVRRERIKLTFYFRFSFRLRELYCCPKRMKYLAANGTATENNNNNNKTSLYDIWHSCYLCMLYVDVTNGDLLNI